MTRNLKDCERREEMTQGQGLPQGGRRPGGLRVGGMGTARGKPRSSGSHPRPLLQAGEGTGAPLKQPSTPLSPQGKPVHHLSPEEENPWCWPTPGGGRNKKSCQVRGRGAQRLAHRWRPIHRPANTSPPDALPHRPDLQTQFLLSGTASLASQKK